MRFYGTQVCNDEIQFIFLYINWDFQYGLRKYSLFVRYQVVVWN